MGATKKADRLFNPHGRRHYRKTYDLRDLPIGLAIVVGLLGIGGWVAYKGAHPDPSLLALDVVPAGAKSAGEAPAAGEGRGPFPEDLAVEGWTESRVRNFGPDTLYVKINGRAGYYKSFGVQQLHFMTLAKDGDPATVVDLELYDHGTSENALGAYNGERGADSQPEVTDEGLTHYARNALYMTIGRFYLRAVGSDESEPVLAQLRRVRTRFEAELEGEPLPWSYALFIGKMGFKPGALAYFTENAFNFSFAKAVNVARLDDETELFVVLASDEAGARAMADKFRGGFREYGAEIETGWVEDQYIQTIATARAKGPWVYGVRGAPDLKSAKASLARLVEGLEGFPVPERRRPAGKSEPRGEDEKPSSDYGEGEGTSPADADEYDTSEGGER